MQQVKFDCRSCDCTAGQLLSMAAPLSTAARQRPASQQLGALTSCSGTIKYFGHPAPPTRRRQASGESQAVGARFAIGTLSVMICTSHKAVHFTAQPATAVAAEAAGCLPPRRRRRVLQPVLAIHSSRWANIVRRTAAWATVHACSPPPSPLCVATGAAVTHTW